MALKEKVKTNNKIDKNEERKQITYSDGTCTIHVPMDVMKKAQERINNISNENNGKSK